MNGQVLVNNGPVWRLSASHGNIVIALLMINMMQQGFSYSRLNMSIFEYSNKSRTLITILSQGIEFQTSVASVNSEVNIKDYDVIKLEIFRISGIDESVNAS